MIHALLDANVIYSAPIRDLLLHLAEDELFMPLWSSRIQMEWSLNLLKERPDINPKSLERTIFLMNESFPDALIEGFEHRIDSLTLNDPDDRHVLAAAIEGGAKYLVTANLKDFDSTDLKSFEIEPVHPDHFIVWLISENGEIAKKSFERMVKGLKNPPQSKEEVLLTLGKCGLPETVRTLVNI